MGTPLADQELKEFRYRYHGTPTSSFLYHYARLIEILACIERVEEMIDDPDLQSKHLRADAGINKLEGVGRQRSAPRHSVPPLQGGRERPDPVDEHDHRHGPEQPGDEQDDGSDRAATSSRTRTRSPKACSIVWRPASARSTRA